MIGIVGKRDPLSDVVKGTNRFEKAIDDLARKFARNPRSPSSGAHQMESLWHLLNNMHHDLRSLRGESKTISPSDQWQDRALPSIDKTGGEPGPLRSPWESKGCDFGLRQLLQQSTLPQGPGQRDAGRCAARSQGSDLARTKGG